MPGNLWTMAVGALVVLSPVWLYAMYRQRQTARASEDYGESAVDATVQVVTWGRMAVFGGFLAAIGVAGELGTFAGDLGFLLSLAPMTFSSIGIIVLGFFGFQNPAVGPNLFVIGSVLLLVAGVVVKNA